MRPAVTAAGAQISEEAARIEQLKVWYTFYIYKEYLKYSSLLMNDLQKLVTEAFFNNGGLELTKTLLQGPPEEPGPSNNNELVHL